MGHIDLRIGFSIAELSQSFTGRPSEIILDGKRHFTLVTISLSDAILMGSNSESTLQ